MNVEYINPFIEASQSVIMMMTGNKPELGKVHIRKSPFSGDNIAVIVGLTGKIRGQVVLSFTQKAALDVASAMMGGITLTALDEISKSAISELANMIMGNTATLLANRGIGIEITPPSLVMGEHLLITPTNMKTICIPLNVSGNKLVDIDVSLADEQN
ncbi:MAG TPA: chemotaxis protein CheX [Clostridiaceae bacterium]|nr:chemotaxis protein CheX [Clostridiaceae bacterium]